MPCSHPRSPVGSLSGSSKQGRRRPATGSLGRADSARARGAAAHRRGPVQRRGRRPPGLRPWPRHGEQEILVRRPRCAARAAIPGYVHGHPWQPRTTTPPLMARAAASGCSRDSSAGSTRMRHETRHEPRQRIPLRAARPRALPGTPRLPSHQLPPVLCPRLIHRPLNHPGQPGRFCSAACRVAEHRRLQQ